MHSYSLLAIKTCHRRGRARDRRHGGTDPDQERRGSQPRGAGQGNRGQGSARRGTVTTARGSRTPALVELARSRRSTSGCRIRTRSTAPRGRRRSRRRPADRARPAMSPSAGLRHNLDVGIQYLGGLAQRQRLRADLQPDGRCGHGGDLALAALAMVASPTRNLDDGRTVTAELMPWAVRRRADKLRERHRARNGSPRDATSCARELIEQIVHDKILQRFHDHGRLRAPGSRLTKEKPMTNDAPQDGQSNSRRAGPRTSAGPASERTLRRGGRRAAARLACRSSTRSHVWAPNGCGSFCTPIHVRPRAGRADRQPGRAAGAGGSEVDLRQRLAGRRRHERRRDRPIPTRACTRPTASRTLVRRINNALSARGSDRSRGGRRRPRATGSRRSSPTPRPASVACSTPSS